jgi:hypothetical protein
MEKTVSVEGDPNGASNQQDRGNKERDSSEDSAFTAWKTAGADKLDERHQKRDNPYRHQSLSAIEVSGGESDQGNCEEKVANRKLRKHDAYRTYNQSHLYNRRTSALIHGDLDLFLLERKIGKHPSTLDFTRYRPLVLGAVSGDASGKNLAALGDIPAKLLRILVIGALGRSTELTYFFSKGGTAAAAIASTASIHIIIHHCVVSFVAHYVSPIKQNQNGI